ncbi:MAG: hypothetical protein LDL26_11650, partial [Caenispirillum bisanense]|nr:hypothetical protein [Caenispirillum bisanense]
GAAESPAAADDRSPTLPFEDAAAAPEAAVSGLSARQRQEIETALAELVALRDELAAELRRQEAA